MKTTSLFYSLIAGAVLWSCIQKSNENSSVIEIDGHKVHYVDISDVKDTITKSLSDFVTVISYIQLETNSECLISQGKWTIGEKYLLIFVQKEGLLQFTRNGKFIRKLISVGKGPREISSYRATAAIYGKNHLIIQSGRERSYLLHIDLNTGEFLENIPVSLKGSLMNIEVKDSTIYCAPLVHGDIGAGKYYLFSQTFSGKLIDTIPAPLQQVHINGEDLLYRVNNTFHYRPVKNDTVFTVNHETLEPYYIFHTGKDPKDKKTRAGDISYMITTDTQNYFIIRRYTTTKVEEFDDGGGKGIKTYGEVHYIFIDKKSGRASIISPTFYNDLYGKNFRYYPYTVFNSEHFLLSIDAVSLLKTIDRIKKDDSVIIKNRDQLIALSKKVSEEDNPILILGKVK